MTFITPLILLFFSGFISIIINNKRALSLLFVITSLVAFCLSVYFLTTSHDNISYIFGGFSQEIGIEFISNPAKLALSSFLCGIIFIFSLFFNGFIRYFKQDFSFNILFCILHIMCASALAIIFTNDLFNFYIFLELLAICSYILTALGKRGATYASFNYLFLGIIASGFLVLGIGILYFSTGYLNISIASDIFLKGTQIKPMIAFAFILLGFLIKLAIFPFSFWPGMVYKNFPNSVLPLYGSIVSITTFYGLFLFSKSFFALETVMLQKLALLLSSAGVIIFSFFSIFENNVKKILAYSGISQVSYAFFIMFLGSDSLTSLAFLHLASNSLSKLALFIIVFEVLKYRNSSVINMFEGLYYRSKLLSIATLFFFANIIGLPVMFGFFTKTSIVLNLIEESSFAFIFIILLGAVLNFIYFWRIASVMFYDVNSQNAIIENTINTKIETKISIILLMIILIASTVYFSDILNFINLNMNKFF